MVYSLATSCVCQRCWRRPHVTLISHVSRHFRLANVWQRLDEVVLQENPSSFHGRLSGDTSAAVVVLSWRRRKLPQNLTTNHISNLETSSSPCIFKTLWLPCTLYVQRCCQDKISRWGLVLWAISIELCHVGLPAFIRLFISNIYIATLQVGLLISASNPNAAEKCCFRLLKEFLREYIVHIRLR